MRNFLYAVVFLTNLCISAKDTIMPLWPKDKIPNAIKNTEKECYEEANILRIGKV